MAVLKNFAILEGRHLKGHFTRIGGHCRSFFLWILQNCPEFLSRRTTLSDCFWINLYFHFLKLYWYSWRWNNSFRNFYIKFFISTYRFLRKINKLVMVFKGDCRTSRVEEFSKFLKNFTGKCDGVYFLIKFHIVTPV